MRSFVILGIAAVMALGGCTASTKSLGSETSLFIGTRNADASANGLPFAVPSSVLANLETAGPMAIKVVRAQTDWDTGATRLVISNETLTLSPGAIAGDLDDVVITLSGETLNFLGGAAPASSGQGDWLSYIVTSGAVSGTGAIYNYAGGSDPLLSGEFDSEAFFAFGYETDPDEIVALVGSAIYSGAFDGYGQVINPTTGAVISSEQEFFGTITLIADFDGAPGSVDGTLVGTFDYSGTSFSVDFAAPIEGGGYLGTLDTMTCSSATCTSDSALAGAFFGADALETSGIIALDVTVEPVGTDAYRFLSGGGFTATQ